MSDPSVAECSPTERETFPLFRAQLEQDGFAVLPAVIDANRRAELIAAVATAQGAGVRSRKESIFGIRNLLESVPLVRSFVQSEEVRSLVTPFLGAHPFAVRVLWFDKTPDANWKVPWHQDLAIAVQGRVEVKGFGGWSEKAGVAHVQPPTWILERMLTVRLHLDDCGSDRGPLRVLPGSHREGRLQPEQIQTWQQKDQAVECAVHAGDAILMRPLLLHASSEATEPGHRRVLHIEFANTDLPGGLHWYSRH